MTMHAKEEITLFTPGPTHIPQRVLRTMADSSMHHRTPEFEAIFKEAQSRFATIVDSPDPPVFLAGSGTCAMETALRNTLNEGDTFLYVSAGKFGERWGEIGEALGFHPIAVPANWGETPTETEVETSCKQHPEAKVFCTQHCETSTTTLHPIEKFVPIVRRELPDALTVVDAISSVTTVPLSVQKLGIDVLVAASQKALMLPPGLSLLVISDRAWKRIFEVDARSLYLDLKQEHKPQSKGSSAWTPALHLIVGLLEVLKLLEEEGSEQFANRHAECSALSHQALSKLGFSLISTEHPSPSVTGAFPPDGVSADEIRRKLFSATGYRIAGGQGEWKGKILRIGHMGVVTPRHLEDLFSALAKVL